jgi:hypothetical protein
VQTLVKFKASVAPKPEWREAYIRSGQAFEKLLRD